MATHAHSTTAPALQPRLLRPFPACQAFKPALADAESTASQPCGFSDLTPKEALASTAQPLLPADTPETVRSDIEALLADHGRAIHFKRALHEAFDFGFALLDALDLSPLALDVIDDGIAALDALDAPDEDLEPWLAGVCDLSFVPGGPALDAENDSEEDEGTALESHGRGFVRAGADDAEEDDEPERDDECGSDDGEDIGHHASQFRPFPLTHAKRAEVAAIAARAALLRRPAHA